MLREDGSLQVSSRRKDGFTKQRSACARQTLASERGIRQEPAAGRGAARVGRAHPGGVLKVALEVNEGDLDVAAPSELALSRETAEGSAHNDDMLG